MVVDRVNRIVLALVGLALLGGTGYGLARGLGAFGNARRGETLLQPGTERWFHDHRTEARLIGLAVALVVALLALRWLIAQLQRWPTKPHDAEVAEAEPVPWRALITASALQESLERKALRHVDVDDAAARVDASGDEPLVALRVASTPEADLGDLTRALRQDALRPLVTLLSSPGCSAHITYGIGEPRPRIVA